MFSWNQFFARNHIHPYHPFFFRNHQGRTIHARGLPTTACQSLIPNRPLRSASSSTANSYCCVFCLVRSSALLTTHHEICTCRWRIYQLSGMGALPWFLRHKPAPDRCRASARLHHIGATPSSAFAPRHCAPGQRQTISACGASGTKRCRVLLHSCIAHLSPFVPDISFFMPPGLKIIKAV